jgi:uroporphyrinogen decarboxylase
MNGRERLLATLRGEPVDRVPIAPYLALNTVYEMFGYLPRMDDFFNPTDFDLPGKFVEYCDYFGFDILHAGGFVHDSWTLDKPGENWDVTVVEEGDDQEKRKTLTIRTPAGDLRQTEEFRQNSPYLYVSAIDEHLIKTKQDFEILRKYCPPPDNINCELITRACAAVGDKGIVDQPIHGVFNVLSLFRKLDDVFADPITDEAWYRDMMEFCADWLISQCMKEIEAGAECFDYGGNLAGSAVGPRYFEKYVMDYENRVIEAIHQAGSLVIYHNCGDAAKIMHLYNRMPMDAWGYLTPPPFGDVDLNEALRVIRPDMALRGNIDQVEFMVKATPQQVQERVRDILLKVKLRGNWILSTTDFFFTGTPYENIHAFTEAGLEYGRY